MALFAWTAFDLTRKFQDMSSPLPQRNARLFRSLVIGTGLCWAIAFVPVALRYQLELYGDGAMFSYAVAVQDVWAFHWHNISGRSAVLLFSLWPAETIVGLTGRPWAGILTYGFLFYIAPLTGLILTWVTDRSSGRILFVYACASTAMLCPLIFGFPTEMWFAQAVFWPTLAISHYAKRTFSGAVLVFVAQLVLAFTHEGALVLLFVIVATVAPHGLRDQRFPRAAICLLLVLMLAAASKVIFPPDDYYAGVLLRAALHFFDLGIFKVEVVLLLLAALIAYGVLFAVMTPVASGRACIFSLGIVLALLSIHWLKFDHAVLASSRYYLRTALVLGIPVLAVMATLSAMAEEEFVVRPLARLRRTLLSPGDRTVCAFAAAFAIVTLIHAVETGKFVIAWTSYRAAITALATGNAADPSLGDPRFVSSARISATPGSLAWFSTIPYLSVVLADFSPNRLVIDPAGNYFWLSCATATQNRDADRAVPRDARELVRVYSCLHR
jgi:hypothetical protein